MAAAVGRVERLEAQMVERVLAGLAEQVDRSAVAAVAAGRTAPRHELLAAEGHAPVPSTPPADVDDGFVDEDHGILRVREEPGVPGSNLLRKLRRGGLFGLSWQDVHELPAAPPVLELHDAVHLGEEGVILAAADVLAGEEDGTALAHDDRAARDALAAEGLDAQVLRVRVAAVAAGALSLFMCHGLVSTP